MRFQIGIYSQDRHRLIADHTALAVGATWTTDDQGDRSLSYSAPLSLRQAARLFDTDELLHVQVSRGSEVIWQGRLSDPGIEATPDGSGVSVLATGYRDALADVLYTALWSDTQLNEWQKVETESDPLAAPERYEFDTNNRLLISPKPGASHGGGDPEPRYGILAYRLPNRGERTRVHLSGTLTHRLPGSSWVAGIVAYTSASNTSTWVRATPIPLIFGTGSETGTVFAVQCAANVEAIGFYVYNQDASPGALSGEPGDWRVAVDGLRLSTVSDGVPFVAGSNTPNPEFSGTDIARGLLAYVRSVNGAQLSGGTFLLQETARALNNAVYEDTTPADILNSIAEIGDGVRPWLWGVRGRELFLQPRDTPGRTWYAPASALRLVRSREELANRVYTVFQEPGNATIRTARLTRTRSVQRYGLTRDRLVTLRSTDAQLAAEVREVALDDAAEPRPRSSIEISEIYSPNGVRVAPWRVRGNDTIIIPNLPITGSAAIERTRRFRVTESTYSADDDRVSVTPDSSLPQLEYLISQIVV